MLVLSAGDKLELQKIVKKHPNWRVRERAYERAAACRRQELPGRG